MLVTYESYILYYLPHVTLNAKLSFLFDTQRKILRKNGYFCASYGCEMKKIPNSALGRLTADEYAGAKKMPVVVVLDNVRSMNNVGSFFRTCDAFSVGSVVLCGITGAPPNREIHKTALGAENTVSWVKENDTVAAVRELKADGYTVVAVEQVEGAAMLQDFECRDDEKYALVFGNEVAGVAQEVVSECDAAIEIPQAGTKHSLNVSVSGGVVLWHFFEQLGLK